MPARTHYLPSRAVLQDWMQPPATQQANRGVSWGALLLEGNKRIAQTQGVRLVLSLDIRVLVSPLFNATFSFVLLRFFFSPPPCPFGSAWIPIAKVYAATSDSYQLSPHRRRRGVEASYLIRPEGSAGRSAFPLSRICADLGRRHYGFHLQAPASEEESAKKNNSEETVPFPETHRSGNEDLCPSKSAALETTSHHRLPDRVSPAAPPRCERSHVGPHTLRRWVKNLVEKEGQPQPGAQ